MPIALELQHVCKGFGAGAGRCVVYADVLRDVDLTVCAGEVVAVVGRHGSGKSTLLLCAAGLVTPESGEVRWFGDPSPAAAVRCAVYYPTLPHVMSAGPANHAQVHLVDNLAASDDTRALTPWITRRRDGGDAIVLATHDAGRADRLASHVFVLRRGCLQPALNAHGRVAEG